MIQVKREEVEAEPHVDVKMGTPVKDVTPTVNVEIMKAANELAKDNMDGATNEVTNEIAEDDMCDIKTEIRTEIKDGVKTEFEVIVID
jgi:hypothetical protein